MKPNALLFTCMLICGLAASVHAQAPVGIASGTKANATVKPMPPSQVHYQSVTPLSPSSGPMRVPAAEGALAPAPAQASADAAPAAFTPRPGDVVSGPRLNLTTAQGTVVPTPTGIKLADTPQE